MFYLIFLRFCNKLTALSFNHLESMTPSIENVPMLHHCIDLFGSAQIDWLPQLIHFEEKGIQDADSR